MVAHRSNKSHIKHNKQVEMHLSLLPKHLIVFDLCSGYKKKKKDKNFDFFFFLQRGAEPLGRCLASRQ